MKLANFLATKRNEIKSVRKSIAVGFATGCAFRALRNDAPVGRTLFYCLVLAISAYAVLFCIDRAIGVVSPIVIDLEKVKGITVSHEDYRLYIENEKFLIKMYSGCEKRIDSFQLFEKIEDDVKLESNYLSWTGENCILRDGGIEYKLDAGLAKHLLAILNCHAEASRACRGLSFIA